MVKWDHVLDTPENRLHVLTEGRDVGFEGKGRAKNDFYVFSLGKWVTRPLIS